MSSFQGYIYYISPLPPGGERMKDHFSGKKMKKDKKEKRGKKEEKGGKKGNDFDVIYIPL